MTLKDNDLWKTFSSVRLALLIISLLAITSIIGTILPQGEPFSFYIEKFGARNAIIFDILAFDDMYYSYWFRALLIVLCLNLIVCTYTRLPGTLKIIKKDNSNVDTRKFQLGKDCFKFDTTCDKTTAVGSVTKALEKLHLKAKQKDSGKEHLFFYERGAWTRLGAYFVHLSILIIVLGAIIGNIYGFKASVMVPEGSSVDFVFSRDDDNKRIPLQFDIFCKDFNIDYYKDGTPKEYKSDLTIVEDGKEVVKKNITVNAPLTYKGITFYQSSYQQIPNEFSVQISKQNDKDYGGRSSQSRNFSTKTKIANSWDEAQATFKIVATSKDGHGHGPYEILFDDEDKKPATFTTNDNDPTVIKRESGTYTFLINQRFATGLQVVKDPGLWIVYIGFGVMLFGLFVCFFTSHRNIWISITGDDMTTTVFVGGKSNKNLHGLSKTVEEIASILQSDKSLELRRV
ncbi:cytochrome c biogenesis protein ResB [Desulforhopalus sp. IMCC35007]|uniref:cytochrome c biogenesis protein ResB n=1 Tax=Desulforhopalus sp. IMCC35007 TaxID=2569543 RepID=UPI0010ADE340|nr:cytochrome c biogenesis protein ResB [Desulforhopalus sp. IMCC35007]TKB11338.1 cytochrome c biogenesis protein ResB [Desulforhopalus sp. IMCC35007]